MTNHLYHDEWTAEDEAAMRRARMLGGVLRTLLIAVGFVAFCVAARGALADGDQRDVYGALYCGPGMWAELDDDAPSGYRCVLSRTYCEERCVEWSAHDCSVVGSSGVVMEQFCGECTKRVRFCGEVVR